MKEARVHLSFVCSLYKMQHDAGRYYVHEHPQLAGSWSEDISKQTEEYTNAYLLTIDQCCYGLTSITPTGEVLPAMKNRRQS